MTLTLDCPSDRSSLDLEDGGAAYVCARCQRRFRTDAGVVRFLGGADDFYEGCYLYTIRCVPRSERIWAAWPLWLMNSGYVWAVRKHLREGRTIIEMGCASGVSYFAKRYRLVGLDLSYSSLRQVSSLYSSCLQADATQPLPIPDGTVDGIISSFFWEHIPPDLKPAVLAQCHRALAPGGKLVFLYDIDSANPLYRLRRRRDPALFREILIDRKGHLSWQSAEANRALFEANGFRMIENLGREKTPLINPAMYDKVLQWPGWTRPLARLGLRLSRAPWFHSYNGGVRVLDATLRRLLPLAWSRVVISVCEKI
jgi:SAM-dependent methyltransferase